MGESHTNKLYETLTRHFQHWKGPTSGPTYTREEVEVQVILTPADKAVDLQDEEICRLWPVDNHSRPACVAEAARISVDLAREVAQGERADQLAEALDRWREHGDDTRAKQLVRLAAPGKAPF